MDTAITSAVLFVFGLIVGSFLNVVVLRLPRGERLTGRSHCARCNRELRALDLVPVLSFLWLRGRCRYCNARISFRYPLLELVTAFLFTIVGLTIGQSVATSAGVFHILFACVVVSLAIAVFVVDLEYYLILDTVVVAASIILLAMLTIMSVVFQTDSVINGVWGAGACVAFLGCIWLVSKGTWMGLGDVKFMVPFGLALGFPGALVGLFLAFILGSIAAIPLLTLGRRSLKTRVPFGTFLSVSLLITFVFGKQILDWYLWFIGVQ
jgi:prepilin signal peptidase PulO-like enzyme (type II secretory pathway)